MQEILIQKLHHYISGNNPDLLIQLQSESNITAYLQEKVASIDGMLEQLLADERPAYVIEELCLDELTKDLRPSKFNYLKAILEEDFNEQFLRFKETGLLTIELINLIQACNTVFDAFSFSEENEDDRFLRLAIAGTIAEHLTNSEAIEL